mmetsp:Transcript_58899/g.133330  ORF Transcript_58899/g.133330 Transcript_58899/m.133330 type:complete len:260 (+) Transcript_58899:155-934(+)
MEFTEGLVKYVTTQQCVVHAPTGRPLAAILHQPFSPDLAPTVAVPATKQVFGGVAGALSTSSASSSYLAALPGRRDDLVAVSRSHTGGAAYLVRELFGPSHEQLSGPPGAVSATTNAWAPPQGGYQPLAAGGAGYKALLVAAGDAGAYLHTTKSKAWDACAADSLLSAMGGALTDTWGEPVLYRPEAPVLTRGLLGASTLSAHRWLLARLRGRAVDLSGSSPGSPSPTSKTGGAVEAAPPETTYIRGVAGGARHGRGAH